MDVVFVSPNNSRESYQGLATTYAAVEPPTWALILAESVRSAGFSCAIIDSLAEGLSDDEVYDRLKKLKPYLICFVVYGQNVNAGTANMTGATRLSAFLKARENDLLIGFVGSHVQALPKETLEKESSIDFAFLNEGICSLHEILSQKPVKTDLSKISGIAHRNLEGAVLINGRAKIVPQNEMDHMMPGYAWDLLPFKERPLDLYRAPFWHANYIDENRSPYAAIQTSIGCQFKCSFCMINLINKDDDAAESIASNYSGMRHWSVECVEKTLEQLVQMGVKTIRITDEMFLLNRKYYLPVVEVLESLNDKDDLFIWAYSRIDTVPNPKILAKLRSAGFRWLCLGIESGDQAIRLEVAKGKFEEVDVTRVIKQVESAGINVMANYIYGLPGDSKETIEKTFALSCELNTLGWNTYAAMALPGSPLYSAAKKAGIKLPQEYHEFAFHSYTTVPLPTNSLSGAEVLKLRDEKFTEYFGRTEFLDKIESQFGRKARDNIVEMTKKKLKRKIIEEVSTKFN